MPKQKDGTPKKRGNQGDFHGKREAFLQARVAKFQELSKKEKKTFWPKFFHEYWRAFPWSLSLNEDPPDDLVPDDTPDSELSPEQRVTKAEVLTAMEKVSVNILHGELGTYAYGLAQKIKSWFGRQKGNATGMRGNPYATWLARLRRPQGGAPKKLVPYQMYMRANSYKEKVEATFVARYTEKVNQKGNIHLRCEVARELYEQESEEVKEEIREMAEKEHKQACEEFEFGSDDDDEEAGEMDLSEKEENMKE